ncbi:hypothetical protein E0F15_14270 [Frankia sp. B2]|nr:hypothetical protein E0F15_14270 [Frankia sp. B2]
MRQVSERADSEYRIVRAAGQTRERRAQATHPPRVRPELSATGPSQVWSRDITALKGPEKGVWYRLYVIIDIYSRYVTGWLVAAAEDAVVAKDFLLPRPRRLAPAVTVPRPAPPPAASGRRSRLGGCRRSVRCRRPATGRAGAGRTGRRGRPRRPGPRSPRRRGGTRR